MLKQAKGEFPIVAACVFLKILHATKPSILHKDRPPVVVRFRLSCLAKADIEVPGEGLDGSCRELQAIVGDNWGRSKHRQWCSRLPVKKQRGSIPLFCSPLTVVQGPQRHVRAQP